MLRLRRHKVLTDPVAVVSRFVDSANRHDADGIAKCLHPDFESIQPVYPSRNFRGSDQVRRNWQAIFESEPGFRLTLVRSSATDDTVWVELHGAGGDVEVAGVFIMGVEDNLVKWARVYSAVIEQPPVVVEPPVEGPVLAVVPITPQAAAEELKRVIEAGREAAQPDAQEQVVESAVAADDGESANLTAPAAEDDADVDSAGSPSSLTLVASAGNESETDHKEKAVYSDITPSADTSDGAESGASVEELAMSQDDDDKGEPATAPKVSPAVAEVQALAESTRPRKPRNRRRGGSGSAAGRDTSPSANDGDTNVVELDDAARVRAAARAATSKAAAIPEGSGKSDPKSTAGDHTANRPKRPPKQR